jgi:hypothetical protein
MVLQAAEAMLLLLPDSMCNTRQSNNDSCCLPACRREHSISKIFAEQLLRWL